MSIKKNSIYRGADDIRFVAHDQIKILRETLETVTGTGGSFYLPRFHVDFLLLAQFFRYLVRNCRTTTVLLIGDYTTQ